MNVSKKEKIVDKIIDVLEGIFGILFIVGATTADSPSLLAPIIYILVTGSILYAVCSLDEWRKIQKHERELRRRIRAVQK